jgi:hypothetical protein
MGSPNYSTDHTAGIFVKDRSQQLRLMFGVDLTPEEMVADIQRLDRESGGALAAAGPATRPVG